MWIPMHITKTMYNIHTLTHTLHQNSIKKTDIATVKKTVIGKYFYGLTDFSKIL